MACASCTNVCFGKGGSVRRRSTPNHFSIITRAKLVLPSSLESVRIGRLATSIEGICDRREAGAPLRKVVIVAEKHFRNRRCAIDLIGIGHRAKHTFCRGGALDLIQAIAEIRVEPGNVDANRAILHAAGATGAEFREARVFKFAGAGFPGAADAAGIRFATKRVAADSLKIGARIQASAAANAIERLVKHGIVAHFQAAVVDQHEMKFARLERLAGHRERRIGERRADEAGVDRHVCPVALIESNSRNGAISSRVGIIFSMPAMAM